MTQYTDVELAGRTYECEWEGEAASGDNWREPRTEASIAIVACVDDDGAAVTLTETQIEEAVRQIWADLHEQAYLDHLS